MTAYFSTRENISNSVATIKAMWQQCVTNGCYSVNATVCWNPDQVTTYLQSTQTV